jgi:hypothetical protein
MAFQRKNPAAVGVKAAYPGFIEPALAATIEKVPRGTRWVHEMKFEGYRVQVHIVNTEVKVFTRRGHDWTNRFKKIAADAWHISAGSAIIDGEAVVPSTDGTTDFSVPQNQLKGRSSKVVMVAFDLLYLNGSDLRSLPLFERKALLKKIIADTDIQFRESYLPFFLAHAPSQQDKGGNQCGGRGSLAASKSCVAMASEKLDALATIDAVAVQDAKVTAARNCRSPVCLLEIKHAHTGDGVRQEMA